MHLITDYDHIEKEINIHTHGPVNALLFERTGESKNSHMRVLGLHRVVEWSNIYQISKEHGLIVVEDDQRIMNVKPLRLNIGAVDALPPHFAIVSAIWDGNIKTSNNQNNIHGDTGLFFLKDMFFKIPVIKANEESLAYYGATLLRDKDVVVFLMDAYPIWGVSIGENYLDDYIMTDVGGGFYIEYHSDVPHFHMPLSDDTNGFYVLGKKISDGGSDKNESIYHFSAFEIPHGMAVYTSGGIIHSSAALVGGKWLIGYFLSKDFSTVRLHSLDHQGMTYIDRISAQ